MKKIICVTGGTSFLGQEVVEVLKQDFEVRVLSRGKPDIGGVEIFSGDICDHELLVKFLKNSSVLVHVLAISNPFDQNIEQINVSLTKKLISVSSKMNVDKVIYISSENVTYDLEDKYTCSKKEAEKIVSGVKNFLILRPSPIFGKNDKRHVMQYARMIKKFPLIPVISSKRSQIQPVYVGDVAEIVKKGIENDVRGVFTIVGTSPLSFKELGLKISNVYGKKRYFVNVPYPAVMLCLWFLRVFNKKLYASVKNALVLRNAADPADIEKLFNYKMPSLETNLRKSLL